MLAVLGLIEDGLCLDELFESQYRNRQVAELDRGGAVCEVLELSEPRNSGQQVNTSKLSLEVDKAVGLEKLGCDGDGDLARRKDLRSEPLKGPSQAFTIGKSLPIAYIRIHGDQAGPMDDGREPAD